MKNNWAELTDTQVLDLVEEAKFKSKSFKSRSRISYYMKGNKERR